ncbi:hypothetical protein CsatB_017244 [Cannabis sativa]
MVQEVGTMISGLLEEATSQFLETNFIKRFKEEASKTMKVDDGLQLALHQAGIRTGTPFWNELQQEGAANLQDFQKRVQKYNNLEEAQIVAYGGYYLTGVSGYAPRAQLSGALPPTTPEMSRIQFSATPGYNQSLSLSPASSHFGAPMGNPSGMSVQTLSQRQNMHYQKPPPLYRDSSRRDPSKRCEYHNDIGHNTNECKNLKDEIENLIRLGHLYEWIKNRLPHLTPALAGGPLPQGGHGGVPGEQVAGVPPGGALPPQVPELPPRPNGRVAMISSGPHIGGTTRNELKHYAGAIKDNEVWEITQLPAQRPRLMDQPITFTEDDAKSVRFPHHDPLIIETPIANKVVIRILVDNGSSMNLLFKEAFMAIGLTDRDLSPSGSQLTGFNGTMLIPMGKVRLPITLCPDTPQSTFKYYTFVVVDCPTVYNAILGRPTLVDFGAITSILQLCLNFSTREAGVGTLRENQGEARQCYNVAMHLSVLVVYRGKEPRFIEQDELDPRIGSETTVEPMEDIEEVVCVTSTPLRLSV